MTRGAAVVLMIAAVLLSACDRKEGYRSRQNPPGQNPAGTPSDRTGGSRNAPDGAGGGPGGNTRPADQ